MYTALVQTLCAAFCAILAHLSQMGGGGMNIAGHHSMLGGARPPQYIQDGLVYIGESIAPPQSGIQSVDVGTGVSPEDWTIEWVGIHAATSRAGVFVNTSTTPSREAPFSFGWWVNSNNTDINCRISSGETNSHQKTGTLAHFATTVEDGVTATFYGAGVAFWTNTSYVANAIQQITSRSPTWRYICCSPTDYITYSSLRVYNRALTAAEIAANYAVDKIRFGLT